MEIPKERKQGRANVILGALVAGVILVGGAFGAKKLLLPQKLDPLYGDAELSTIALTNLFERTPLDKRHQLLSQHRDDPSPGLRYAVIDVMGSQRDFRYIPEIEAAFYDSSSMVRQRVLESLPNIDRDRALRMIVIGLQDDDQWIRDAALSQISAGLIGKRKYIDRRIVPFLIQVMLRENPYRMTLAMNCLKQVTNKPWRSNSKMTVEQRLLLRKKWLDWWEVEQKNYPLDPELAALKPIQPTRADFAPDFNIEDTKGDTFALTKQKGRVTLINFWGTWCGPCQLETADLAALHRAYKGQDFDMIGIAFDEPRNVQDFEKWCEQRNIGYRLSLDAKGAKKYFEDIVELPVTYLIDKKGQIRYRWDGEREYETFRLAVDRLLKE